MIELRYIIRPGWDYAKKVLQYRETIMVTDYRTEKHVTKPEWTDWMDVPVVKDES